MHPDPDQLLAQADSLIASHKDETDLRRAVSSSYYALFHFTLRAAADLVIGAGNRGTPRYNLAYRSIDHGTLKSIYEQLRSLTLNDRIKPYAPTIKPPAGAKHKNEFGDLSDFASLTLNLQGERNFADYDLMQSFDVMRAKQAVTTARDAINLYKMSLLEQREAFLPLLLFKIR